MLEYEQAAAMYRHACHTPFQNQLTYATCHAKWGVLMVACWSKPVRIAWGSTESQRQKAILLNSIASVDAVLNNGVGQVSVILLLS